MNLDKLFAWIIGIAITFAACSQLDTLQRWIWRAPTQAVYKLRTSTWGSPRFLLRDRHQKQRNSNQTTIGEPVVHKKSHHGLTRESKE